MTHPRSLLRPAVGMMLAGTFVLAGCAATPAAAGGDDSEADVTITVTDMSYQPAEVTIHPGDTVEWVFDDGGLPHDVSGLDEMEGVLQSDLMTEGTFTFTFDEAGTYTYTCTPHPMMLGTVVVEAP